jgi:hypothetical protein
VSYPRHQLARTFKFAQRTAGNIALNSSLAWTNIDTALDMVLAAQVGDVVECCVSTYFGDAAEIGSGSLDFATIVGGVAVNYVGSTGGTADFATPWTIPAQLKFVMYGTAMRTLIAGDISSGTVTLRLRGRTDTANARTMRGTAQFPLKVWAKNLGPQDPN